MLILGTSDCSNDYTNIHAPFFDNLQSGGLLLISLYFPCKVFTKQKTSLYIPITLKCIVLLKTSNNCYRASHIICRVWLSSLTPWELEEKLDCGIYLLLEGRSIRCIVVSKFLPYIYLLLFFSITSKFIKYCSSVQLPHSTYKLSLEVVLHAEHKFIFY